MIRRSEHANFGEQSVLGRGPAKVQSPKMGIILDESEEQKGEQCGQA